MFIRSKFVTNSSSTSIIAFGICIDRNKFDELEESLPKGIDYKDHWDYDQVYIHIGFPKMLKEDGTLEFPPADCLKEKFEVLKAWMKEHGIDEQIYYIEDGWYDG